MKWKLMCLNMCIENCVYTVNVCERMRRSIFLKLVAFANINDQRKSEMCTCAIKYIPSFGLKIGSGRTG